MTSSPFLLLVLITFYIITAAPLNVTHARDIQYDNVGLPEDNSVKHEAPRSVSAWRVLQTSEDSSDDNNDKRTETADENNEEMEDSVSVAGGALLLAITSMLVAIFYLVHSKHEIIRGHAWEMISATVSIFIAVMWFQVIGALFTEIFGDVEEDIDHVSRAAAGLIHLVMWKYYAMGLCFCVLIRTKEKNAELDLNVTGTAIIGAHLCAFSARECFTTINRGTLFVNSIGGSVASLALACFITLCIIAMSRITSRCFLHVHLSSSGKIKLTRAVHILNEDMAAIALSDSFAYVIRFLILEKAPASDLRYYAATLSQSLALLFCAIFMMGCAVIITLRCFRKISHLNSPEALHVCSHFLVLTGAWCLLYWGNWELCHKRLSGVYTYFTSLMLLAYGFSVISMLMLGIFNCLASEHLTGVRAIRPVIEASSLLVGFTWEKTFDHAVEELVDTAHNKTWRVVSKVLLGVVMTVMTAPVWRWHILPEAVREEKIEIAEEISEDNSHSNTEPDDASTQKEEWVEVTPPGEGDRNEHVCTIGTQSHNFGL